MIDPHEYSPWDFWLDADDAAREQQLALQRRLTARPSHSFGERCFVSHAASVNNDELRLGDGTYIAAGAYLTGRLVAGRDISLNPYTVVRGDVRIGDATRIGAHTSILGFNHAMDDPELEIRQQPLVTKGITIGSDVWVGSHVVILDGVTVGDRAVLAAGAIVTKNVPAGAVVAGNPARFLRWRIAPPEGVRVDPLAERLHSFAEHARSQAHTVLDRSWGTEAGLFADRPGVAPTVRAQCDAVEVADLLLGSPPTQLSAEAQVARLRDWQDPASGLVAPLATNGAPGLVSRGDPNAAYHVLSAGYALELLGSSFDTPIDLIVDSTAGAMTEALDALPWESDPWNAGHWVDAYGTALRWSIERGDPVPDGLPEALFGWLTTRVDSDTGLWGCTEDLLLAVNGWYRATRGTFAQFGICVPLPERVIDSVLRHCRDLRYFGPGVLDACNVLDVVYPLWLTRSIGYREEEVRAVALRLLDAALPGWVEGAGFPFRIPDASSVRLPGTEPGLQGTEMWLAIVWYIADLLGAAPALGYRPRGVHRPESAGKLTVDHPALHGHVTDRRRFPVRS